MSDDPPPEDLDDELADLEGELADLDGSGEELGTDDLDEELADLDASGEELGTDDLDEELGVDGLDEEFDVGSQDAGSADAVDADLGGDVDADLGGDVDADLGASTDADVGASGSVSAGEIGGTDTSSGLGGTDTSSGIGDAYGSGGSLSLAYLGVAAMTGLWLLFLGLLELTGYVDSLLLDLAIVLSSVISFVGLPVAVFFDARTAGDGRGWSPRTPFWVVASLVPLVNVGIGLLYLLRRRMAVADTPSPRAWVWLVAAATGLMFVYPVSVAVMSDVGPLPLIHVIVWAFAVGCIYYDAQYVEATSDWDPLVSFWVGGAVLTNLFAFFWTPVYLAWRTVRTLLAANR